MEELIPYDQWINYRRKDKTPCGSINDAGKTFTEAMERVNRNIENIGIGFVLNKNDPFICIDMDHCVMKNGKIDPDVKKIIKDIGSYAELSPNDGVHIWLKGKLPKEGYKSGNLEIYCSKRYVTVTMNQIGDISEINERQDKLDSLMSKMRITAK